MLYHGGFIRERITALTSILCGILATLTSFSSLYAGSVTLAWDPSPDASVVAYKIYYGPTSGGYTNSIQVANVTNATIVGLVEGATYYFGATALDGSGFESDFSNETQYAVPVPVGNQTPTLNALTSVTINEGAGLQTVNLAGITSGATNEIQTLTVTATSSNPGLIPNPTVNYTSPNTTGSIAFTPVALAFGSATVTVTVNDGGASNNIVTRAFTVTVNHLPTISPIADQAIAIDSATAPIPFTIGDSETSVSSLSLSASSSNLLLVRSTDIVLGGAGGNRTVTVTPLPGQTGFADITITVSDGTGSASRTFLLDVKPKPTAPANLRVVQALP
jgi:hypothetical protein